jgi:hypothetical protein
MAFVGGPIYIGRFGVERDCGKSLTQAAPGKAKTHMVKAHFHCHAPTCIKMEMWNNDTGKLLCRETTLHGGTGKIDLPRFDEPGWVR